MNDRERAHLDTLLDLLTDEVARRLAERAGIVQPEAESPATMTAGASQPPMAKTSPSESELTASSPFAQPAETGPSAEPQSSGELTDEIPSRGETHQEPTPPTSTASLLALLAFAVLVIVALINIPFNAQGTSLARAIPTSASLVIRNGLVVKEQTSPELWVYRDGTFHWITSLDELGHLGYHWSDVHIVEPGYLSHFAKGNPLYVLLKCDGSAPIYELDQGHKRWIVDLATLKAQGFVWDDVQIVPCAELKNIPNGDSIPPGHGSPP